MNDDGTEEISTAALGVAVLVVGTLAALPWVLAGACLWLVWRLL